MQQAALRQQGTLPSAVLPAQGHQDDAGDRASATSHAEGLQTFYTTSLLLAYAQVAVSLMQGHWSTDLAWWFSLHEMSIFCIGMPVAVYKYSCCLQAEAKLLQPDCALI